MADTGKWFKFTPFGGFRRQDVITYIEALLREHHEEAEAYRTGADLLRRERDEARERLSELQSQYDELSLRSKQFPSMQSDVDSLKARVNQLSSERTRLSERLQKMEGAREADRAAMSRLQFFLSEKEGRLSELQARLDDLNAAEISAQTIEKQARERVRAIEAEALDNAERSRETLSCLWQDTRDKYAALCREAEDASNAAVKELEKARALLIDAGQVFDGVNSRLESLRLPEKSVPDSEEPPRPLSGEPSSLEALLAQQKRTQTGQASDLPSDNRGTPEDVGNDAGQPEE